MLKKNKLAEARKIEKVITLYQSRLASEEAEAQKRHDEKEQMEVYHQHEKEMNKFRETWDSIFERYRRKEQVMKLKLEVEHEREARELSHNLSLQADKIFENDSNFQRAK